MKIGKLSLFHKQLELSVLFEKIKEQGFFPDTGTI